MLSLQLAYKTVEKMAKKQSQYQEMSLFDDSSFGEQPALEDAAKEEQDKSSKEIPSVHRQRRREPMDEKVRVRSKKQRLRVTFTDGVVICDVNATTTMMQVIEKLGFERVASLGLEVCHVPLVSREIVPRYAPWTKEMADGWYLMAQSDTKQKYMQVKAILAQLDEEAKAEIGDFEQFASDKNEGKRNGCKRKAKLCVTFSDGYVACSNDHQQVFAETVRIIGLDKVKKTHLQIAGKPIVTSEKKYSNQVRLLSGEWLTVPSQAKDKYKILRVLSSMTHTPYEVKIIE